jgi:hypothetical protein
MYFFIITFLHQSKSFSDGGNYKQKHTRKTKSREALASDGSTRGKLLCGWSGKPCHLTSIFGKEMLWSGPAPLPQ